MSALSFWCWFHSRHIIHNILQIMKLGFSWLLMELFLTSHAASQEGGEISNPQIVLHLTPQNDLCNPHDDTW